MRNPGGHHSVVLAALAISSLLIAGCVGSSFFDSSPKVTLDAVNSTIGRVPLWPMFTYICSDPNNDLVACEVYQDDRLLTKEAHLGTDWYKNIQRFKTFGPHTISIMATNSKGENASKTLTFDVINTIYISFAPLPSGVDPVYIDAVRAAFSYWKKRDGIIFREASTVTPDTVQVNWHLAPMFGNAIGYAGYDSMNITLGGGGCLDKFRWYTPQTVMRIARHELGHTIGYDHTFDPDFVMNTSDPIAGVRYRAAWDDDMAMQPHWNAPFGVCTFLNTTIYNFQVTSDRPVDVHVVPSVNEYNNYIATSGQKWERIAGCSAEDTMNATIRCNVTSSAFLVVMNINQPVAVANIHVKAWEDECEGECKGRFSTTNSTVP